MSRPISQPLGVGEQRDGCVTHNLHAAKQLDLRSAADWADLDTSRGIVPGQRLGVGRTPDQRKYWKHVRLTFELSFQRNDHAPATHKPRNRRPVWVTKWMTHIRL